MHRNKGSMASVFLVDDHADVRDVVGQLLKMHGHTVEFITSGEDAIQRLDSVCPHAVIADHRLPGMNGVELLRKVRSDPRCTGVCCILFSADADTRHLAEEAGAHAFWVKGSDAVFDSIAQLDSLICDNSKVSR